MSVVSLWLQGGQEELPLRAADVGDDVAGMM